MPISSMAAAASSSISSASSPFLSLKDAGVSQFLAHPSSSIKIAHKKVSTKIMSVMAERKPSATGSVKTGMTMTEKIFSRASEKSSLSPGENVWVDVDVLMTHDVCGPGSIGIFKKEFGNDAKVWDREKVVIIPDHYIFTSDERANRNVDIIREFSHEQGIKYFYDIKDLSDFRANPDYKGVCHVALAQEGHCRPGEVLLGTDSHTCTAGAFGQFATGIGNTDAGFVLGTGKALLKVPPTLRFVLDGEMPDYLLAKDLILQIIGEISVSGATYKAMEFVGSTIESLTMEERMTLCNMVVEAGGKNGIVPADATTFEYLETRTSVPYEPVYSDEHARFLAEYRIDVSKLEPLVAKPHSPDNRALARECKDVKIDRVYIGSCTGGKTEDFLAAAKVFLASGEKVKVPTFLVPATQKVWMDLYSLPVPGAGGKTCSQIFEAAGCDTPTSPSCGACLGGPKDTYARINEPQVCVSTTNRNFPGRMGHKDGQIYLASPYTAAASALTGFVLLGTDSHTCTAGAFGQFATGIGNTDAGFVLGTGKALLKVPPALRFVLDGEMPDYLLAKDLILQIIGEISVSGATYKAMEFVGSTIESLTMEERMTLCNMVVEAGGKNGIVPADATTFEYLETRTSVPYEPVYSDEHARFLAEYRIDVSKLEPLVAKPHSPDNRALARECKDVKIDRVYIGSCTGGKTEDFLAAAKVFLASGEKVKVPTFLVPATQKVWMDLYSLPVPGAGGKTCSQIFEAAGCDTPTSPSCGACLGGPKDTYARINEPQVCVSTTNRNFPGRMGHKDGQIYLASPYTAAASALTGFVSDPRDFLR